MPTSQYSTGASLHAAVPHGTNTYTPPAERNAYRIRGNASIQVHYPASSEVVLGRPVMLAAGSFLFLVFLILRCFRKYGKQSVSIDKLGRRLAKSRGDCGDDEERSTYVEANVSELTECNTYVSNLVQLVIDKVLASMELEASQLISKCAMEALIRMHKEFDNWASSVQQATQLSPSEHRIQNEVSTFRFLALVSKSKEALEANMRELVDSKLRLLSALVNELQQNRLRLQSEATSIPEALASRKQLKNHCQESLFLARSRLPEVLSKIHAKIAEMREAPTISGQATTDELECLSTDLQQLVLAERANRNKNTVPFLAQLKSCLKELDEIFAKLRDSGLVSSHDEALLEELSDITTIVWVAQQSEAVEAGELSLFLLRRAARGPETELKHFLMSVESTIQSAVQHAESEDNENAQAKLRTALLELEDIAQTLETSGTATALNHIRGAASMLHIMAVLLDPVFSKGTEKDEAASEQSVISAEQRLKIPHRRAESASTASYLGDCKRIALTTIGMHSRGSRKSIFSDAEHMRSNFRERVADCSDLLKGALCPREASTEQSGDAEEALLRVGQILKAPLIGSPAAISRFVETCNSAKEQMRLASNFEELVSERIDEAQEAVKERMEAQLSAHALIDMEDALAGIRTETSAAIETIGALGYRGPSEASGRSKRTLLNHLLSIQEHISETERDFKNVETADWSVESKINYLSIRMQEIATQLGGLEKYVFEFVTAIKNFSDITQEVRSLIQRYACMQLQVAISLLERVKEAAEVGGGRSVNETTWRETVRLVDKALSHLPLTEFDLQNENLAPLVGNVLIAQTFVVDIMNMLDSSDEDDVLANAYGAFFVLEALFFNHLAPHLYPKSG